MSLTLLSRSRCDSRLSLAATLPCLLLLSACAPGGDAGNPGNPAHSGHPGHATSQRYDQMVREQAIPVWEELTEAIRLDPDNAEAYKKRGMLLVEVFAYRRAIPDLDQAIRLRPDDPELYKARGDVYAKPGGQQPKGIKDYTEAIRLRPDYAEAYVARGYTLATFKSNPVSRERALKDFATAMRLDPDNPRIYERRAGAYLSWDEDDLSMQDINRAIRLYPAFREAYFLRAHIFVRKKDYDSATAEYSKALRFRLTYDAFPADSDIYLFRALAYEKNGDIDRGNADRREKDRLEGK